MSKLVRVSIAVLFFELIGTIAYAGTLGGGTMPWSPALTTLRNDLSGPTAAAIAIIGTVVVFGILIFGHELTQFGRSICYVILCASVLVGLNAGVSVLGITGTTIDEPAGYDFFGVLAAFVITNLAWIVGLWLRRRWLAVKPKLAEAETADVLINQPL